MVKICNKTVKGWKFGGKSKKVTITCILGYPILEGLLRAKILPDMMESIQKGFGFFILVDITLMLIYWLLHLYHAYFTFQVRIQNLPLFLVSTLRKALSLLWHLPWSYSLNSRGCSCFLTQAPGGWFSFSTGDIFPQVHRGCRGRHSKTWRCKDVIWGRTRQTGQTFFWKISMDRKIF